MGIVISKICISKRNPLQNESLGGCLIYYELRVYIEGILWAFI